MPELPEVEALRRALDEPVRAFPIERAGPAHAATLKTIDPPLSALEGRRLAGALRRGKRLLFETDDGALVLMAHLMSAGRLRYLGAGETAPKAPAFRLRFQAGGQLVLTEAGSKKRAGVWLLTPARAEEELAHLGPEALGIGAAELGGILAARPRRLHPLLRDQRALAGIGRAWSNEILHRAKLSPFALSTKLSGQEVERLAEAIGAELERGLELRLRGASDATTYRVHDRLGEPCPDCDTPIARVDYEEHTIFYCPSCQTGGRLRSPYHGLSKRGWEAVAYNRGGRRRRR
ncbi:MAG TPA: DNA-formamidopyrimidine glycosylase family protein [Gaiellaceae bacterium]|nr:DNA-formamidopyrimidine glycosylase family protein [Gaiellaceae bacterium]